MEEQPIWDDFKKIYFASQTEKNCSNFFEEIALIWTVQSMRQMEFKCFYC